MSKSLATVTAEAVIGDVLTAHPLAVQIIEKYFGNGCFTCPGMKIESISFGAMMHGMDPDPIVQALRELPDVEERGAHRDEGAKLP